MAILNKLRKKLEASLPETEFDHAYFDQLAAASSYTQTTIVHPGVSDTTAPATLEPAASRSEIGHQPGAAHDIMAPAPTTAAATAYQTLDLKQSNLAQSASQQRFHHVLDTRS